MTAAQIASLVTSVVALLTSLSAHYRLSIGKRKLP